jgi:hypothetical protein
VLSKATQYETPLLAGLHEADIRHPSHGRSTAAAPPEETSYWRWSSSRRVENVCCWSLNGSIPYPTAFSSPSLLSGHFVVTDIRDRKWKPAHRVCFGHLVNQSRASGTRVSSGNRSDRPKASASLLLHVPHRRKPLPLAMPVINGLRRFLAWS